MTARYIETITVDPDDLTAYPGNPNTGDVDLIRASVRRNGQYRAVNARRLPDGTLQLLAGHTTTAAIHAEGQPVRVEVIEADDRTARRIVAVDNASARKATLDEEALFKLLDKANAEDGLEGTGYDDAEFRELVDKAMRAPGPGKEAPEDFASYDEDTITTEHTCPKCGYQWSGGA